MAEKHNNKYSLSCYILDICNFGLSQSSKRLSWYLTIAFVAFPIVERYVRPFTNKFIEKAFVWIFSPKERLNFKENISEIYTKNNPQPKMILSTIESYYTK